MTTPTPRLVLLEPVVLDHRRVMLILKTADLPPRPHKGACLVNFVPPGGTSVTSAVPAPNVTLDFEIGAPTIPISPPQPPAQPNLAPSPEAGAEAPEVSLYPNVELSLLDADNNEVAQAVIIEHQEEEISFTLHLRNPQLGQTYTARADMIHQQQRLQTLSAPFVLAAAKADIE